MIAFLKKRKKKIVFAFVGLMLFQVFSPSVVFALTSGPTQPEVQSFQPVSATEMVDLFTGDFSYNIPLFELPGPNGGYPFNLSYQSGITMDQESSWVGLGWNLQPGSINIQRRGLPDEFKGDEVKTKMSIDPSVTVGLGAGGSIEIFGGAGELVIGLGVYQNSYRGFGYSIDGTVGFKKTVQGMTGSLGLGFSLDSKEGVSVNPSLGLGTKIGEFGLGAGYNSKQGLSNVSLSHSADMSRVFKRPIDKGLQAGIGNSSATLTFAHPGYTPQITMPMKNINVSATFKAGGSWWGLFGAAYVKGFYSEQWLDKDKKKVTTGGYGYLNYQYAGSKDLLDFNREKDGMVSKETPNLAIPSLTYDIYSVTGQGIGMMYRPMRNDYGIVYDQETSSVSDAVSAGVDVGPAASHVGVNLGVNHSSSTSGLWSKNNLLMAKAGFQKKNVNDLYEPWYFKVHGEPVSEKAATLNSIGGERAMRVKVNGGFDAFGTEPTATGSLENPLLNVPSNASLNRERKPRNHSIIPVTNEEVLNTAGEVVPEFKVRYINNAGSEVNFDRTVQPKHHFAGFTALTAEGLRYIYAIPAYNKHQEDVIFSSQKPAANQSRVNASDNGFGDPNYNVTGTDKFLKKTELPPYAHSFLLTSIVGPDYVDVTNNGVTDDDLGYWVKFTYKKTTTDASPYKWRDPYIMAHYQEGWRSDPRDDKGSFVYGEKEMWYLARAETKSHIAVFEIEAREDGRGVTSKFQTSSDPKGEAVYALKTIKLCSRLAPAQPIKTTRFEYDYSLCPGIENSSTGKGKLTLKKLWFEYGNSERGKFNPYVFSYSNETTGAIAYNMTAYDRWGNYKPYPANLPLYNIDFPYAEQDPLKKASIDANAAAWSLKEIQLPSGGKIIVDYESDDYAYVQNKTAMQMNAIVDPNATLPGGTLVNTFTLTNSNRKIRFKLEKTITGTLSTEQQKNEVLKYIDTKTWQLYFKLLMRLRSSGESATDEYITGYADIDPDGEMALERATSTGPYVYGYFMVKAEEGRHPFSMRAWQHLRTNQPDLALGGRKLKQTNSKSERINQIKSLGSIVGEIKKMFLGFYNYCELKGWSKTVTADKSWVRLNSPDKIKYGGGLRVKQITIKDNWAQDDDGVYGQTYDYTTSENGQTISSGVAAYEPIIGGDENALRHAKKYVQSIPLRSDNNLFFEYPVNESYYPGPQVGYSKVTVMSLPSAKLSGKVPRNTGTMFPTTAGASFGTSGSTVHEFYTAKDFPVISDETDKFNKQFKLSIPIPFLGTISATKLSTSQGYSIVTNDMHGKPKQVSNYRQDKAGKPEPEPISWVKYNYMSEQRVHNKEKVTVLLNTLKDNTDGTLSKPLPGDLINSSIAKYHFGQEVELFHDMRQFEDRAWDGGAKFNKDILYIPTPFGFVPIPIPTVWPGIGKSTAQLRTAVTNKVIFKTGILESVEAFDGGSLVKTTNLKWDKQTGQVVLTSVNNNFDNPVYSYSRPAYLEYQGMGAAHKNIGLTFSISSVQKHPYKNELYQFYTSLPNGTLHPGDEILLYPKDGELQNPITKVVYTGNVEEDDMLYTEQPLTETTYRCMIVRSGYRNQLTVNAGTITALQDPSVKGVPVTYNKTISVPKSN